MLLMSIQRRQRSGNGVRFRETMTGSLRVSGVSRTTRLTLHAHIAGGRNFLHDPNHPISLSGTIDIEGLTTARAATGTLELFPDPGDVAMRYRLQTTQDNGDALILTGTKHQHRSPLRLWSDLTTLSVEAADTVGILRISPLGTLTLPSSIRGDAFTRTKRAKAAARFLTYFTKSGHGTATTALRAGIQHCPHLRREVIEHSLKSSTADYSPLQVPTAADTGVTVAVVVTTTAAGRRR
jgi:cholesterol oxidase